MKRLIYTAIMTLTYLLPQAQPIFIGSSGRAADGGIYSARFNRTTEAIEIGKQLTPLKGASFYALSKDGKFLFTFGRMTEGDLLIYQFRIKKNRLEVVDSVATQAKELCHISLTENEDALLVASYGDGLIEAFPLNPKKHFSSKGVVKRHTDYLLQPEFQGRKSHAHQIRQYNGYIYVADLGLDAVFVYRLNADGFTLINTLKEVDGAGPRHVDFSPDGKSMALINELNNTISVYTPDREGVFSRRIQTLSTLPPDYTGKNQCADIHYSPCGRWLYGSNRGHNSIACFTVDNQTNKLSQLKLTERVLDWPRNFGLTRDGKYVVVLNERGNSITLFTINPQDGTLSETRKAEGITAPACVVF